MIRVWQFSDTHLYADADAEFCGVNPERSLRRLLEAAARTTPRADLALVTGDLVHDGSAAGYRRFRDHFATLGIPVYCLPGNHDDQRVMAGVLSGGAVCRAGAVTLSGWQIILLDSTVPGCAGGRLGRVELERLAGRLAADPVRHALVCLHHPPLPSGMRWMDEDMLLDNPQALFEVLDAHPRVRAVLWGHVHQAFETVRNGVSCLAAPSTMVQFQPGSDVFRVDPLPPGYRWLELYPDGRINTGVTRLGSAV